jgi:type IV secretion system protein VirB5
MANPLAFIARAASKAQGGHDFNSGEVRRYGPDQPFLSPFQAARQEWDDRMGRQAKRAANWRLMAVAQPPVLALLAGLLAYREFFAPVPVWAVPTDAAGVVAGEARRMEARRWEPNRAQVAADIARWIEWVRTRPADGVKLRADLAKSYEFLGPDASRKFKAYVERFDPWAAYRTPGRMAARTVTMTYPKVLQLEGDSYHAEWTETVWEHGQPRPPYAVTATFAATAPGQANEARMSLNPAGTVIHDFDWRGAATP